ncbi:rRNA methyltransferase 3A, mitochondrial [Scomber scombrus]|uniref:rRNA methyltransferase 3A, mitochondrial n=1 Tax=Scomber scombrus TaxID=13677 RepID=UPI002DDBC4D8|nr:rRNA methyltransferase 3A, mitochondrial [Scomber scombrus]
MAASYAKNVICALSLNRNALLTRSNSFIVESKRYVRGLRRTPFKVLLPENETGEVLKQSEPAVQSMKRQKELKVTSSTGEHPGESDLFRASGSLKSAHVAATKDHIDGLRFERALPGDKRLGKVVSVARSRTFREHQGKILLEGRRLICDALNAGARPQMVFFSTVDRLRELPLDKLRGATLVKVKFEDIKIWSDLVAPQGVIAIFSRPDPSRLKFVNTSHSVPLSLICDNIRDPGNLGTMLRCAAAAGCHNVLLTKGCVDAWEPKVLRGAMGAHFRLPIYPSLTWDDIENHLPKSVTVHVADNSCDRSRETEDVQVNASHKPSKAGDYGWVSTKNNPNNMRYQEYDLDSDSDCEDVGLSIPRVDSKLYHESWAQSPTALVVGGETHGLSLEAVQLAKKTSGQRLFIPIVPDVDSLNSAMAASILLFEGRKQLLKLIQTSGRKWKSNAEQQFS